MDSQFLLAAVQNVREAASSVADVAAQAAPEAAHAAEASGGPLGTFGVNWKLFVAQLVNFGIVLFVFWRWVVKPLGRTLEARQAKIESGLKNARAMEEERKALEEQKVLEMKRVRAEAEGIIKTATETAEKIKSDTIASAHGQAEKLIQQTKASLAQEREKIVSEVKSQVADLVVAATERVLAEKLDSARDRELIKDSLNKVQNL